jgi:hypothetical protein
VIELHDQQGDRSDDLVDTAMRSTWRQSGHVRVVDRGQLGGAEVPLMARLRF